MHSEWKNSLRSLLVIGSPAAVLGMLAALLVTCTTTPVTGRRGLALVPEGQMTEMGVQAYTEMKQETPVVNDADVKAMVERVGRRIAVASGADYQWEFTVFKDDKTVNAFCLPGGKIGVYTGILPVAKTEAGLAAILGHEVAHATAQHSRERVSQQLLSNAGLIAAGVGLADNANRGLIMAGLGLGTQVGIMLPFSRKHENEADSIGLVYMAKAGYDPREAVALWQRMAQSEKGAPPEFLSTHPLSENRVTAIQAQLDKVLPIYARSEKQPSELLVR